MSGGRVVHRASRAAVYDVWRDLRLKRGFPKSHLNCQRSGKRSHDDGDNSGNAAAELIPCALMRHFFDFTFKKAQLAAIWLGSNVLRYLPHGGVETHVTVKHVKLALSLCISSRSQGLCELVKRSARTPPDCSLVSATRMSEQVGIMLY